MYIYSPEGAQLRLEEEDEEDEEEQGLFRAHAVKEEDPGRDRATHRFFFLARPRATPGDECPRLKGTQI